MNLVPWLQLIYDHSERLSGKGRGCCNRNPTCSHEEAGRSGLAHMALVNVPIFLMQQLCKVKARALCQRNPLEVLNAGWQGLTSHPGSQNGRGRATLNPCPLNLAGGTSQSLGYKF